MAGSGERPIVIKRIKKGGHAHHGGAWKIAYADFVTAMMAFFLLMWLVNAATEQQLAGIAEYFAPTSASTSTSGSGGIMGGKTIGEGAKPSMTSNAVTTITLPPAVSPLGSGGADAFDEPPPKEIEEDALEKALAEKEQALFEKTKEVLENLLNETPDFQGLAKHIFIDNTPEGLRIQIVDQEDQAMFPSGSNEMSQTARKIIRIITQVIKKMPQKISITGHTDSKPYVDPNGYGNWELSADRALASRRELIYFGEPPEKIHRVAGMAEIEPFLANNPGAPQNRRISIILLREHHLGLTRPTNPDKRSKPKNPFIRER